jgi:hypothetical protein
MTRSLSTRITPRQRAILLDCVPFQPKLMSSRRLRRQHGLKQV